MPHGRGLSFCREAAGMLRQQHDTAAGGKVFLPYFLYFTKSRRKKCRKAAKGFNFVSAWSLFGCADSRFGKPRTSRKGNGFILFASCKKNQKARQRLASLWTPGTIQSSAGNTVGEDSDGTSRNRFFAQNAGVKALNRCEVRVLQRKELERRLKEKPYSSQTVGYGWVRICGFSCRKGLLWRAIWKGWCKKKAFVCKKVSV